MRKTLVFIILWLCFLITKAQNQDNIPYQKIKEYIDSKFRDWESTVNKEETSINIAKAKYEEIYYKAIGIYATSKFNEAIARKNLQYDTESETMQVDLKNFTPIYFEIPKHDYQIILNNAEQTTFYNTKFTIVNNRYTILNTTLLSTVSKKSFTYNSEKEYIFKNNTIKYNIQSYVSFPSFEGYPIDDIDTIKTIDLVNNNDKKVDTVEKKEIQPATTQVILAKTPTIVPKANAEETVLPTSEEQKILTILEGQLAEALKNEDYEKAGKIQSLIDLKSQASENYQVLSTQQLKIEIRQAFKDNNEKKINLLKEELKKRNADDGILSAPTEELNTLLEKAIQSEDYQKATLIQEELELRKK